MGKKTLIAKHCVIYTDASFDPFKCEGQGAYHISWGKQVRENITKVFKAIDSTEAELIGAYEALKAMQDTNRTHFLIVCDNISVVNLLDRNRGIISKEILFKYTVITKVKELAARNNYIIKTKHIKSHDKSNVSKASKMNKRVDKLSKTYKKKKRIVC